MSIAKPVVRTPQISALLETHFVVVIAQGVMIGLTLATTPAMIYRAMLEAIAYGTRLFPYA